MDVSLVRWPTESARRSLLISRNAPRLLLVENGTAPPSDGDCLEDWIRLPASDLDMRLRLDALTGRAARHERRVPDVDADGVLRHGSAWVPLPPVEARLTSALLERFGLVVSRDALARSGWPEGTPGRNALDVHVLRLRRRIEPVGLVIRTVRSRGYLLEVAPRNGALVDLASSG
ncbi:MAG: hypothetical protein NVS3B12_24940 [Acidimicrobiales bacterium]